LQGIILIIPKILWYYCRAFPLVRQGKIVLHTQELDETAKQYKYINPLIL